MTARLNTSKNQKREMQYSLECARNYTSNIDCLKKNILITKYYLPNVNLKEHLERYNLVSCKYTITRI